MSRPNLLIFLLAGLLIAPMVSATEGRAAPQCAEFDLSDVVTSSSGVAVEPGACLIVDIGVRSHTTTLAIDIEVLDDAMDVLMFDQGTVQTYKNGQNYRSSFNAESSFESMIGSQWLDWAPPQSINAKNWYIVFDNSEHDGDEGLGDQGGMTSRFKLQLAPASVEDYPLIHDTFILQPGERINLASFSVDSGTDLSYWAHPISGSGDMFIQSDNQLSGDLIISDSGMEDFGGQDTTQIDWTVPQFLDLQNLNLMAEAGSSALHFTVKAWFDPVLSPTIVDYSNSTTTIGEKITLDASNTPNSLQQVQSLSWDFDSDNVVDATGNLVEASWSTPGVKTVNLTAQSQSGETTMVSYQVEVLDIEDPIAVITGAGGVIDLNGDRRLLRLSDLVLQASNSYDDHAIASASWSVDGEPLSSASQFTVSWSEIGTYVVTLTVSDPSGNTGSVNTTIVVYDSTEPILVTSDITEITEVEQGEEIELKAKAADEWDSQENLRFTWDLDLERDTNGDGDPTNDADFTGSSLAISFDDIGEARFAVTVYDESNNSDFEIFEIQVTEPPSEAGLIAIVSIVFASILVVSGVVLFGYRGIQRRHAVELLMEGGLSQVEAKARILSTARGTKLPMFANAYQMAGITDGAVIMSAGQMQTEAKAQEFAAIYGNESQQDPNAGFRPSSSVRQVDPALAEAALAAFADEPEKPTVAPSAPVSGKVRSGGVSLPRSKPPNE
ncbi:MAG: PKD domain-containing protein [Candidatus Poseidoniaceae archaeon]|nr:PKD domain-containing protein [Candidatus Poseidoniaceae archaeon]